VPIPEQIIQLIVDELRSGADLQDLATKYGVTPGAIIRWAHERHGAPSHGGATATATANGEETDSRSTGRYSREFKQEVVAQVMTGRTATDVAKQYGICEATIYRWKKKAQEEGGEVPAAKSTKPATNASPINEEHRALVLQIKEANPKMGPAQIQNQLKRFHAVKIGRQMIGRIFAEAGIPLQKHSGPDGENDRTDNRFEMSRPNELWAIDFKEFWIHSEKAFGLFILDDFSRFCVGFALTQKPTADLAIETVTGAIQRYGRPERILSDRGPQFHSWNGVSRFDKFLGEFLTDHTVTKAGHCFTNGKIEAFNRTLDEELLLMEEFPSLKAAAEGVDTFLASYNFLRTHMGICGLVPADRYFGMVKEAQQALTNGLLKTGPGLTWLGHLISQDGPGMRHPTLLQLAVNGGKLELVALGHRFPLG
jgi:transposase InsO family protein/transposase-like protein